MFLLKRRINFIVIMLAIICFGAEWDYTGNAYSISSEDWSPTGICKDGDYWYMVGSGNDNVYQYDNDWNYTGLAYYVGNEETRPMGIFKDDDYWYLVGSRRDSVFRYDNNWSYTGTAYYVGNEDNNPSGIFKNEDYWYMVGSENYNVYKYDNNWSYTGIAYYIGSEDLTPQGIFKNGNYWYLVGSQNDSIYKYEGPPIQNPSIPTLIRIFDNAIFNAYASPYVCTLSITSSDPQSDDIQCEIKWDTDHGFLNASSETTGIYPSGDTIITTILLGLTPAEAETIFYWKARVRDPSGSNLWSDWSKTRSFTIDMEIEDDFPYWYQVAGDQFNQCTKYNVAVQGDSVVIPSTAEIEFQQASGSTGLSHSIDIGSPGNNRLVVVIAGDESSGTSLTNVTVDGKNCTKAGEADNTYGFGNHQELWYILEETLGSSNGIVNVTCTGGDAGWATHVHVYYGVNQSAPYDFEIEEAIVGGNTISVENISSLDGSVVIFGAGQGTGGLSPSWTSPLTVRTNGPDPSSTDLATASNLESFGQTNKTYVCTWSAAFNRGTGIVAVWEPAEPNEGTLLSPPIAYSDFTTENSNRNNWDGVKWTKSNANDSIGVQIEYKSGGVWSLVPEIDLPGNSNVFFDNSSDFCTIDLSSLSPTTYDTLRMKAIFVRGSGKATSNPVLKMWALGNTNDNVTGVIDSENSLVFALNKIVPNPFLDRTEICYQIPKRANVNIRIFDIMGRDVVTLVNGVKEPGYYNVDWRGIDKNGEQLPSGIYFIQMVSEDFNDSQKVLIVR